MERNLCEVEVNNKTRNGFPVYVVCPKSPLYRLQVHTDPSAC